MYLCLSLGFELGAQPLYLAHVNRSSLKVMLNGWADGGESENTGHAPQILVRDGEVEVVIGQLVGFNILLADGGLDFMSVAGGIYPRAAMGSDGTKLVIYMDRNGSLHLNEIVEGSLRDRALVGKVAIKTSSEGQLPWDMAIDGAGTAHLLVEDDTQGPDALLYQTVDATDHVSAPVFVTSELVSDLPGMQHYALETDLCHRPTVVAITQSNNQEQTGASMLPVLKILEVR